MNDRFDFLELGNEKPVAEPPEDTSGAVGVNTTPWKPVRLRAVEVIGEQGTGSGQFAAPTCLAVDRDGALYVVDSNNHRVQRIAANGDVKLYGRAGNMPGQFWGPAAVAVDPTGQYFFVAEQGNHRIQCFQFNGQHRGVMTGFRSPSGLAFDAEGMLWIADTGNARVLRYNMHTGQFLPQQFQRAQGLARPLALACDKLHNVYVTDGAAQDVIRFNYAGVRQSALGDNRRLTGPSQVAIDAQQRIYLAETEADRLHVFSLEGESLMTFTSPSGKVGPLRAPGGVALGPNGEIYVADTQNHRILRLAWD